MLRFFVSETFEEITLEGKLKKRYAISNYGRLVSFKEEPIDGRFVKGTKINGYRIFRYKYHDENKKIIYKHYFFYKLVAEYFLSKDSDDQVYVLHLDRNRANDHEDNLQWADRAEMLAHAKASPFVIEAKKKLIEHKIKSDGNKLTVTEVMRLKKKLLDPNRKTRLKIIAKKFVVSEKTLHRIKTGENWGHIQV
jgi:hypothetical protein